MKNHQNNNSLRYRSVLYPDFNNKKERGDRDIGRVVMRYFVMPALFFLAGYALRKFTAPNSKTETLDSVKENFVDRHGFSDSTPNSMKEEKTGDIDIEDESFLLFNQLIHRREIVCIVADAGVGKTFLAIFLAKNASNLKTTFFALDDHGDTQLKRLQGIPCMQYIGYNEFNKYLEELKNDSANICKQRAFWDKAFKSQAQIEERKLKLMDELGISDPRKMDKLFLFELLVEFRYSDSNIIVLDSLNSLLDFEFKINRLIVDRISEYCRRAGKTLIILHHTNRKNEFAGNSSLKQTVDLMLKMDKISDTLRRITVGKNRYRQKCMECIVEMVSEGNNSVCFDLKDDIIHRKSYPNLGDRVLEVLETEDTITFDYLADILGVINKTSLKNALKTLQDDGLVAKADGKTWDIVQNCKVGKNG